ncbi:MAG: response regulator [Bdellovibrionota bacterium]
MKHKSQEVLVISERSIWILEDDSGCRFVYEQILGIRHKVRFFQTLVEFEFALSEGQKSLPELVLADVVLEDGSFLHFLNHSQKKELLSIPFIVVSSIDDIDALRFCFNEGAVDYLVKPFQKSELIVKVERILEKKTKRGWEFAARLF